MAAVLRVSCCAVLYYLLSRSILPTSINYNGIFFSARHVLEEDKKTTWVVFLCACVIKSYHLLSLFDFFLHSYSYAEKYILANDDENRIDETSILLHS